MGALGVGLGVVEDAGLGVVAHVGLKGGDAGLEGQGEGVVLGAERSDGLSGQEVVVGAVQGG